MRLSSILPFLLVTAFAAPALAIQTENKLPAEAERALQSPGKVILYSLEPWEEAGARDKTLQHYKVLGQTELDRKTSATAIGEFRSAISGWDGLIAACFDPRHALRVTSAGHTYDYLLCYACHQMAVYRDDKQLGFVGVAGSAKVLNALLAAAKVPVSTRFSEEAEAAQAKQEEADEARWRQAMPRSLAPLRESAMRDELSSDLKPLRAALAKEFPDTRQRILALFTWFGSGAGPWSGFPSYESVPEELLLDFATPDLVAAAQTEGLNATQIEGAARLFGGWEFGQRRPSDARTLPASLKKKLLDHSLKSTDADKLGRARHAFAER